MKTIYISCNVYINKKNKKLGVKFIAKRKWTLVHKNKEARVYMTSSGKKVTKLTPSGKVKRYGRELNSGINSKTGEKLNACAAGYRMGYRAALGEQSAIYKAKMGRN